MGDVFSHWKIAVDSVARANDRLKLMTVVNRLNAWSSGPEQTWFGDFRQEHFEKLSKNMQQIYDVLRDPKLTITCDPKLDKYALTVPGTRKIKLGSCWMQETRPYEKTQTLVHEAAHITGVVDIAEGRKYEPACAKRLAMQNCFKAMRNADNYGYYALNNIAEYQNADPNNCLKNEKVIDYSPQKPCR